MHGEPEPLHGLKMSTINRLTFLQSFNFKCYSLLKFSLRKCFHDPLTSHYFLTPHTQSKSNIEKVKYTRSLELKGESNELKLNYIGRVWFQKFKICVTNSRIGS